MTRACDQSFWTSKNIGNGRFCYDDSNAIQGDFYGGLSTLVPAYQCQTNKQHADLHFEFQTANSESSRRTKPVE